MRMKYSVILTFTAISVSALAQRVQRLDPLLDHLVAPDAKLERIATGFNKWTEGPVWTNQGTLYFTDPPYGLQTQSDNDPAKELQINGVYRIPAARQQKPGTQPDRQKLQLVIKDLRRPNGIAFSPDEKFLYIAESGRKVWLRYRVQPDGSVSDGVLILDPSSDKAPGGPDGIRVDEKGNLYGSGPGGVWVISRAGKHLGTIKVPEIVSNVAWGDEDHKTLYITASTSIYRIRLKVPGASFTKGSATGSR